MPKYTAADGSEIVVGAEPSSENGYITVTAFYADGEPRPAALNGVAVNKLSSKPETLETAEIRQKLVAEVSDNATYGENLSSSLPVPGNRMLGPFAVLCWAVICIVGVGGGVASDGQRLLLVQKQLRGGQGRPVGQCGAVRNAASADASGARNAGSLP